jgi:hypothetical protein
VDEMNDDHDNDGKSDAIDTDDVNEGVPSGSDTERD